MPESRMQELIETIHALSPEIRYVAVYRAGYLASRTKAGLAAGSSGESDKYEELIVNPTLLTLVRQRGNIDCGGVEYVLIRYGNFFEYVAPMREGHVSVGIEPHADALGLAARIRETVGRLDR